MSAFSDRIRGQKTGVFKVADFAGDREAMLTIDYLEEEVEMFDKTVDLLHFTETKQQLSINQTNAEFLLNTLGDNPEKWKGQRVVLYLAQYEYGGGSGYTIRIKLRDAASQPAVKEGTIIPPSRGDGASKTPARSSSSSQPDRESDLDDLINF